MARAALFAAIAWTASACTFLDPLSDLSGGGASGAACPEPGNAGAGSAYAWRQTKAYFSSDTRPAVQGPLDPQTAGGINVIAIGWNNPTGSVTVNDSNGNCYTPAGAIVRGKTLSQVIYYATNIKAGNNMVVVDFSPPASSPDVRITEYSGGSSHPTPAQASSQDSTMAAAVGPLATTGHNEVVVLAGMTVGGFASVDSPFTTRIITMPNADVYADEISPAAGNAFASATLAPVDEWLLQLAVFH